MNLGIRILTVAILLGTALSAAGDAVQYQYDALGRLASACFVEQSRLVTYTYDAAGNRKQLATTTVSCGVPGFVIDNAVPVRAGTPLTFKIRRLGPISASNAVSYATANGTAIAGTHYTATSGLLTFIAGDFEKSFTVNTTSGSVPSGSVSLFANLSNPTNGAIIQTAQAGGTIKANETPVAINDEHWGTYTVFETVPVYVLPNDIDPDGDPLTITNAVCESTGCAVSVVNGQYLNVTGTTPIFKIVRYWISDGQGGAANATVQVAEFYEEDPDCGEFWC